MKRLEDIESLLDKQSDPVRAVHSSRFFKTGPGEYGEGDCFRGIRVPVLRKLARAADTVPLTDIVELLASTFHEDRLLALLILVRRYERGDATVRERIFHIYMDQVDFVNNWDLVDSSAEHIVGAHLEDRDKYLLLDWAHSTSIWKRRIAVLSTFRYIKDGRFETFLQLAEELVGDEEDLIQKAVGWMLREVGERDRGVEEGFLRRHYEQMPRTMLRYAIEKFDESTRQDYLKGRI